MNGSSLLLPASVCGGGLAPQVRQLVLPWPAAVIGAGAAVLAAPLLLRPLPDAFVNGRAALVAFASASALLAFGLVSLQ